MIIDRIPFPRPDDPLMSARQRAADKAGGNGFMQVAATHAALLLAQGTGRLIRTTTDRGVVAVLDPRLATARYGGFLKASLPPMWTTTDPAVVRKALARLAAAAGPETSRRPVVASAGRTGRMRRWATCARASGRSGLVALVLVASTACASQRRPGAGRRPRSASALASRRSRASTAAPRLRAAAAAARTATTAAKTRISGCNTDGATYEVCFSSPAHPRRQRPGGGTPLHRHLQLRRRGRLAADRDVPLGHPGHHQGDRGRPEARRPRRDRGRRGHDHQAGRPRGDLADRERRPDARQRRGLQGRLPALGAAAARPRRRRTSTT